jgi:D-glycero-alpha-D-manno-heptose-7-phosphate kinase
MRNPIAKAIFEENGVESGDVISLSDVPCIGSGLGGSSAFCISLIRALNPHIYATDTIAKLACEIEIDKCGYPIGIQDQYAIARGGMNLLTFHHNPRQAVVTSSVNLRSETAQLLNKRLLLIYSGISRDGSAGQILQQQQQEMLSDEKFELVQRIRDRAYQSLELLNKGKLNDFGELLHDNWLDKRSLSSSLSNDRFNEMYEYGLANGALGGKLLGAGGGGFFLFYCPNDDIVRTLAGQIIFRFPGSQNFPFRFTEGSTRIFNT